MTERIRAHVWIEGRVQGVFFRAATRSRALDLGLSGWVRNLPDERVEAVFEGPSPAVDTAVSWCRSGPPNAVVTVVEERREPLEGLTGFLVR